MLNAMRRHASGVVMKGFLLLIVLSFVVWGITDFLNPSAGTNSVATVGRTQISVETFRDNFNRAVQRTGQQLGRPLSPSDARAIGLDRGVLAELTGEASLDENARQLGISIPDDVVARAVREDQNFAGANGRFDINTFNQLLRANGFTEATYVAEQRRLMARRQIVDSLAGGMNVPPSMIDAVFRHQSERRSASYLLLPSPALDSIAAPDDAALQAFFEERQGAFQEPERRALQILAATPETLVAGTEVSDEDVRARYDQKQDEFVTPERRTFQRIPFANLQQAQEAKAEIDGGTSFEDIATSRNVAAADLNLGPTTRGAVIDQRLAEAAFSLPQGQVSDPVQGQFSIALIRVTAIEPEVVRSFEDVREQLRTDLARERATQRLQEVHDRIEDARAGGSTLAEAAQAQSLDVTSVQGVSRQGLLPSGEQAQVPGGQPVLDAAFGSDVGVENDAVRLPAGGYVWYEVTAVDPSRARTFDEARADVLTRWRTEEARTALEAKAAAALEQLRAGTLRLPDLAQREGVEVLSAETLTRRGGDPVLGQAGTAQVFSTPRGGFGIAPGQNETVRVVFQVTRVETPPVDPASPAFEQLGERLGDSIENDLAGQYVARLQQDLGATVNPQALATALGTAAQD
jgi:peptidyl-prolyl cis-trans isomerase D